MQLTFEEVAGRELAHLYAAALFLSAGSRRAAEARVIVVMERAAERWFDGVAEDSGVWLEDWLVRSFLDDERGDRGIESHLELGASTPTRSAKQMASRLPSRRSGASSPATFLAGLTPERVYAAAAVLPPCARAAVWLVQFRRRRYADVAEILDVEMAELRRLLRYRETLLAELIERQDRGRATRDA